MIKRRFFKQDHGDQSGSSSDSSSELDSGSDVPDQHEEEVDESEDEAKQINGAKENQEEEEEGEEEDDKAEEENDIQPSLLSTGSVYESEDSSGNEVDEDSLGLVEEENDAEEKEEEKKDQSGENGDKKLELDSCILRWKSVFKCKFCPRIVCLSEKIVKQHLESKRHKRSKKLFEGGRLKVMLNSDGELEEDFETHAERYARTLALAEEGPHVAKKDSGRKRQRLRKKKRAARKGGEKKAEKEVGISKKKKQKTKD